MESTDEPSPRGVTLLDRGAKERREAEQLGPWALRSAASAGRRVPEPADRLRTEYERDRDRIVHTTAFRRLMYKTQVFVNREGDHNRTRLSHSLEVAQVARSVGGALRLNDPLCEALALAHDIGHPPFGHRGEWALDRQMEDYGGFRHNAQVLRVIDVLERRSPDYTGLNLTRETRESLLKHEKAEDWPDEFGDKPRHPYLEAQVVDLADSTAYNVHDVEDGLRSGMFSEADLEQGSRLWRTSRERVERRHPGFLTSTDDSALRIKRVSNELIKRCIEDLIEASALNIAAAGLAAPDHARRREGMTIGHSAELAPLVAELQQFLYRRFYRHPHLQKLTEYAAEVVRVLFAGYLASPADLPPWYRQWIEEVGLERAICDYIAGMTDRFAEAEFARLGGRRPAAT